MKTVDHLLEETGRSVEETAAAARLTPERMLAIADGRWLPSPDERSRIADALGVSMDQVSWGHTMTPRNVRYHRFGIRKDS